MFSLKAVRLKTQEELTFQFKSKGRKRLVSRLEGHLAGGVPSYSGEGQISVVFGPSAAQSKPSHIREGGNLLDSVH